MKVTSKLAMGLHMLVAINEFGGQFKMTSEFLSKSLQVNPVVVRQILVGLNGAGITKIVERNRGVEIVRPLCEISMYDIFMAVQGEGNIFGFHGEPNAQCPVGRNIHNLLDGRFDGLQAQFLESLKLQTLDEIIEDFAGLKNKGVE